MTAHLQTEHSRLRGRLRAAGTALATMLLGLVLVPVLAGSAQACSCVGWTDAQAFAAADVVFAGEVTDVADRSGDGVFAFGELVVARLAVDEVYKGQTTVSTDVTTPADEASCGFGFEPGEAYVVAATYGGGVVRDIADDALVTSLCSGTRLTAGDLPDLAASAPLAMDSADDEDSGFPLLGWLSFGAVALLGLMPIALWLRFTSSRGRTG